MPSVMRKGEVHLHPPSSSSSSYSSSSPSSSSESSSSSSDDEKKKKKQKKKKKKKDKVTRKEAEKVSVPVYPKMHQLDLWKSQLTMALVSRCIWGYRSQQMVEMVIAVMEYESQSRLTKQGQ